MSAVAVGRVARVEESQSVADSVRAILSAPDAELNHARAKLALDALIDPSFDADWANAELDRLAGLARGMAGPEASEGARLGAIRRLIYDEGPWNEHRPFRYNLDRPEGTHIPDKLLANYLRTRLGNCVSMPSLMVILAEKLGIATLSLARAPCHIFVRYAPADCPPLNIEATSGGYPARLEWFRENFFMTDRALESGLYMRTLSKRESVAAMATTVLEHMGERQRHRDVIAVAAAILEHSPNDGETIVHAASAHGWLIQAEFAANYPVPFLIPEPLRPRYRYLSAQNDRLFARAEALGWTPDPEEPPPGLAAFPGPARRRVAELAHPESMIATERKNPCS